MRIGIDARFYGGAYGKGLGRYCEQLIAQLEVIDHVNEYVIFLRRDNWDAYTPGNPRFRKQLADVRWYSLAEQVQLPRIFNRAQLDLLHVPHFNVPVLYRRPFVATVHDLIILHYPTRRASTLGPLRYAVKQASYRWVIASAVRRAQQVLAVSPFTKKDIVDYFHLPEDRVTVTYEAVAPLASQPDVSVLSRLSIRGRYLLYVGNAYPHKNTERLLRVFLQLRQHQPDVQLVLVGKRDYFYDRLQAAAGAHAGKAIVFAGQVSDAELAALYQHSALFVFPSLYEGFGFPPLEAMAAGTLVAAARASCLPEILGDAAIYFDPENDLDFLKALESALALAPEEKKQYTDLGKQQVAKFSWKRCAEETLEAYQRGSRQNF